MASNTISSGETLPVGKSIFSSNGKNELTRNQAVGGVMLSRALFDANLGPVAQT